MALDVLGIDLACARITGLEAEEITEEQREMLDLRCIRTQCLQARNELLTRNCRCVFGRRPVRVAEQRSGYAIRRLTHGRTDCAPHCRFGETSVLLETFEEFRQQTRLA